MSRRSRRGARTGVGVFTWANGERCSGQFLRGMREGLSTLSYPDGSVFIGTYVHDKRHGDGIFIYANGKSEAQHWEEGELISSTVIMGALDEENNNG